MIGTTPNVEPRSRVDTFLKHKLMLGFFGPNCSSGLACTKVPERWSGSWADNLRLARMGDEAGIDFILPVARWKGYGGATNFEGAVLETNIWTAGILASTERITAFATVHVPLVHPIYAAKQFVTADQIGRGRFALNIVTGWNEDEFEMFGVEQREHDERYAYATEWLAVLDRLWSEPTSFDVDGRFFHLRNVEAEPKPFGGTRPIVMNAGGSRAGRAFGAAHGDVLFRPCITLETAAADVTQTIAEGVANGRRVGVFTTAYVVCRPTQRESEEYERYVVDEADWAAIDHHLGVATRNNQVRVHLTPDELFRERRRQAVGHGGYPIVGDPDAVAATLADLSAAGFAGIGINFVNYLDEFPYFQAEVLPRLERLGLRLTAEDVR
jgi:FMNH2-dependent dimethyl sulfone monooxygenase